MAAALVTPQSSLLLAHDVCSESGGGLLSPQSAMVGHVLKLNTGVEVVGLTRLLLLQDLSMEVWRLRCKDLRVLSKDVEEYFCR